MCIVSSLAPSVGASFFASVAHAEIPQIASDAQVPAALFMLSLYNRGFAGGSSGVCMDFSNHDGKSEIKIGLNDSAFEVGKSSLKDSKVYQERMQSVLNALAIAQGSSVQAEVSGYADGLSYRSGSGKNKELAEDRAQTIASLFKNDSNISVQSTDGYDSPRLEKLYAKHQGGSCAERRKVVITIPAKENKVQIETNGKFQFTPAAYSDALSSVSRKIAENAINDSLEQLEEQAPKKALSDSEKADALYQAMKTSGKLSKACDQFPLKQLTLSYIASAMSGLNFGYTTGVGVKRNANGSYYVEDPNTRQKLDLSPLNDSGTPSVVYACFKSDSTWDNSISQFNQRTGGGTFLSGKDLLAASGKSNFTDSSSIQVGFDPSLMKEETVASDPRVPDAKKSPRVGKNLRGFFCKQCGHGFFFEETKDANGNTVFNPVYDDRVVKASVATGAKAGQVGGANADALTVALNNLSKEDPLALGAALKPTMYVVNNCSGCKCDPMKQIREKAAGVTKIDPLADGPQSDFEASVKKKDMESACVVRPPVWHTCGSAPNEVKSAKFDDFKGSLKYVDPVDGTEYAANDLNDLVAKLGSHCAFSATKSPQEKINSVACSGSAATTLPSQDELADCQK